jgi:uncharacterized protein
MQYVIICTDRQNSGDMRKAHREAHLRYLRETGFVAQAGPFLDAGGAMCGSLIVIDVDTRDAAEEWAAGDPYALAGLFEKVEIRAWRRVIG